MKKNIYTYIHSFPRISHTTIVQFPKWKYPSQYIIHFRFTDPQKKKKKKDHEITFLLLNFPPEKNFHQGRASLPWSHHSPRHSMKPCCRVINSRISTKNLPWYLPPPPPPRFNTRPHDLLIISTTLQQTHTHTRTLFLSEKTANLSLQPSLFLLLHFTYDISITTHWWNSIHHSTYPCDE